MSVIKVSDIQISLEAGVVIREILADPAGIGIGIPGTAIIEIIAAPAIRIIGIILITGQIIRLHIACIKYRRCPELTAHRMTVIVIRGI